MTETRHIRYKWFNNGKMPNTLYKLQLPKGRKYKTNLQIFLQATCFSEVKTFGKLHHNLGTFKTSYHKKSVGARNNSSMHFFNLHVVHIGPGVWKL